MIEILTASGATIRAEVSTPQQRGMLYVAAHALGGEVVRTQIAIDSAEVMRIADEAIIGTRMVDGEGGEYELWPEGWFLNGDCIISPPFDRMVEVSVPSATNNESEAAS